MKKCIKKRKYFQRIYIEISCYLNIISCIDTMAINENLPCQIRQRCRQLFTVGTRVKKHDSLANCQTPCS